jgi:hypothetical protein
MMKRQCNALLRRSRRLGEYANVQEILMHAWDHLYRRGGFRKSLARANGIWKRIFTSPKVSSTGVSEYSGIEGNSG